MNRSALGWLPIAFVVGCGSSGGAASDSSSDGGAPAEFIAYADSFNDFHSWQNAVAVGPDDAGDGLHVGPMQVYWNQSPPHGSTSFPVGTIIVKETTSPDINPPVVFSMVKRGDGFNSGNGGANGWEWYSLTDNGDGTVGILWSGVVPQAGETYANQAIGDCNGCHTLSKNDCVWDLALQLSSF